MLDMKIDQHGLDFIESWELFVAYWYDDKVPMRRIGGKLQYPEWKGGAVRGTLTIGIGHTKAARSHVDLEVGKRLTHEEARRILDIDLDPCEDCVNKRVKVELTQGQFNALVSFVYNCGEGAFMKSSILAKLNAGNYDGARAAFDKYVFSKGERMKGLQRRRDAEQALWDEHPAIDNFMPTKDDPVEHPAEVDAPDQPTMTKSTEGWASAGQVVGGVAGDVHEGFNASDAADKVIEAKDKAEQLGVQPIELFGKAQHVLEYLIHSPTFWFCTAIAVAGVYIWFRRRWRMKQEA